MPRKSSAGSPATAPKGQIPASLDGLRVPLASLKPYTRNPRQGDVGAIVSSLERHGQYRPIVVNARTQEVLAGNHTVAAARELGWGEIAATFVDVDEDTAARIVLIDNRSNDLASYDDQALIDLLQSLPDLDGTGFDGDALDELLADLAPGGTPGADTDPIEPPVEPTSRIGDLYSLGPHRLLCGDATSASDVERLLDGARPDAVFTDPPYGIAYADVKGKHRPIANDGTDPQEMVRDSLALLGLDAKAPVYVCCDWRSLQSMRDALAANGITEKACLVWDKQQGVQNLDRYHKQHELILYAGPFGGEKTLRGDVWPLLREPNPGDHPTPKPVALIEIALGDSTSWGALIADPFAGSGSTLVACENLGRRCCAMELDPGYCDVIVDRWERHTNQKAELVREVEHAAA